MFTLIFMRVADALFAKEKTAHHRQFSMLI